MQMYLSTTLLITLSVLRTSTSQFEEYHWAPLPSLSPPSSSTQPEPQPTELSQTYSAEMVVPPSPTSYVYPLYLRLTSRGKTQIPWSSAAAAAAAANEEKSPLAPSSSSLQTTGDEQLASTVDEYRVPSHLVPLSPMAAAQKHHQHRNTTTATQFIVDGETHGEQINVDDDDDHHQKTNNSSAAGSAEQNDNAIGVEHLPTIAIPFLDTLTHGILAEIHQHVQLIKPGTKWCGEGNKARHYDDVGVLHKTDKCCRNHDKCPYYILSHENKFGLQNDAHFTRSHCDCDASFYDCLKRVNSPFSTGVGITYFNILRMKCFRLEYPVVMCSQSTGWFSKHCVEYIVDVGKRKQWQWFDNHEF